MTRIPLLYSLRQPTSLLIFLGSVLVFFDFNYYLMATLPGNRDNMCVMGANFTPFNISFSIVFSILLGIMVAGMIPLFQRQQNRRGMIATGSFSGIAAVMGFFTVFCTICSLSVISLFGLSVGLGFFTDYNLFFKLGSLLLLGGGLWMLNRQLRGECQVCRTEK